MRKDLGWFAHEPVKPLAAFRLPLRAGIAAGIALGVALAFSFGSPIYAVVTAVVVTDLDPAQTRKLAGPRILGTCIGGIFGGVATLLVHPGIAPVVVTVILAMYVCQLLHLPAAARLAGYVSAIIILGYASDPWTHARDRLIETVVGILAAAAISALPLRYRPETEKNG